MAPEKRREATHPIPVSVRAPSEARHIPMRPSSLAEPRSLQQWLPDVVFGFENLASHKLRSLLTMLGMIFGVAAVVAMLSIGAGAQQKVMAFIEQLGVRNLIVEAKEAQNEQELQKVRKISNGLRLSDYQIIRKNVPSIQMGTPRKRFTPTKVLPKPQVEVPTVYGVEPSYLEIGHLRVMEGRFFDATDAEVVRGILNASHHNAGDFSVIVPAELLAQQKRTEQLFNTVMVAIASISLLVGGIGIMNIMLAAILERTREIGVRRAVGATQKDIIRQFVIEAVLISFAGGLLGILLGFAMSQLIAWLAGWSTIVTISSILLAFVVSISVGLIFGIYPAVKAARLDPVEAIRYE